MEAIARQQAGDAPGTAEFRDRHLVQGAPLDQRLRLRDAHTRYPESGLEHGVGVGRRGPVVVSSFSTSAAAGDGVRKLEVTFFQIGTLAPNQDKVLGYLHRIGTRASHSIFSIPHSSFLTPHSSRPSAATFITCTMPLRVHSLWGGPIAFLERKTLQRAALLLLLSWPIITMQAMAVVMLVRSDGHQTSVPCMQCRTYI